MPIFSRTELSYLCFIPTIPVFLMGGALAGEPGAGSSMVQRELERRQTALLEGQMLLEKGDEAYTAGKYNEAVEAYAGARAAFPDATATAALRAAATQRYVQASIELGRMLSRKGDVPGAKVVLDAVLAEEVAPDDILAKAFRAELDDPIRTNPALTKEHAADIDSVRRLLYTAQGAFDLGKFNEAKTHYEAALRLDPYNQAARRGLERTAAEKTDYYGAAYDQARASTLAEVAGAWELPLAPELVVPELPGADQFGGDNTGFLPVSNKLSRIMIPEFRLEQVTLMEAVELLRVRAAEFDTLVLDPAQKGINITVNLGNPQSPEAREILERTFDLNVSNVPVDQILRYITDLTGTTYRPDDFAVTITPQGGDSGTDLISRTYRVPPDFMSNLGTGAAVEGEAEDIFNSEASEGGVLAQRMGAQEALAAQGVTFPEGASATFNPSSNTLRVVNTGSNQDIIEQIVDSISQTEPVSVAVRVTMIRVQQNRLEELGFDWMLSNFGFGPDSWIPGASQLNLSGGTVGNGSPITDIDPIPGTFFPGNPITSGNRSGDGAINNDSIDSLINAGSTGGRQISNRAPGVFGVNGVLGGAGVQTLLRGLDQKKGVDLMAQPSVTTRSGQAASIKLVNEFIYPTEYEPPELPNTVGTTATSGGSFPVTPATPTAFETRDDVGVKLEVLPVADAQRQFVDITLNPSVVDFDGFLNYGSPITSSTNGIFGPVSRVITDNAILMPVFSILRTNTNLIVRDGATIVIGGLLRDEIEDVEDRTPVLGSLPIVGRLFQTEAKSHTSTAIVFLVSVELLDPTGRPYRDR